LSRCASINVCHDLLLSLRLEDPNLDDEEEAPPPPPLLNVCGSSDPETRTPNCLPPPPPPPEPRVPRIVLPEAPASPSAAARGTCC
jgi:hypothetical protein